MSNKTKEVAQAEVTTDNPTMEDILSSIRKIINDDAETAVDGLIADEDVLELTEVVNDDGSITSLVGKDSNMEKKQEEVAIDTPVQNKETAVEESTGTPEDISTPVAEAIAEVPEDIASHTETVADENLADLTESEIPTNLNSIFQEEEGKDPSANLSEAVAAVAQANPIEHQEAQMETPTMTNTPETSPKATATEQDAILSQNVADASVATLAALSGFFIKL